MKKENKTKKSVKKAAPVVAKPKQKKALAKPAKKVPAKKKAKPVKKPVANTTGAKVADLLKNTLVTQTPSIVKPAVVETVKLASPKPPAPSGATINAQNFRPVCKDFKVIRPFTRFRAAGV